MSATQEWRSVSKNEPCWKCGKSDWCAVSTDGAVARCMRVADGAFKACEDGGWAHRLRESPVEIPANKPKQRRKGGKRASGDWGERIARQCAATTDEMLVPLAEQWRIPVAVLRVLGVAWSDRQEAWLFPMRRGTDGGIVGVCRRFRDGSKLHVKGSKLGLFTPWPIPTEDPLFLPEGASDVAALMGLGLVAAGRPSNTAGAADCKAVAMGRRIVVLAENDAKPDGSWPGKTGAERIATAVAATAAEVFVAFPPDGVKDVRDWIAAGATREDLLAVVGGAKRVEPGTAPSHPYSMTSTGIAMRRLTKDGEVHDLLTNFSARIAEDVLVDDGLGEPRREFTIEADYAGRTYRCRVPARSFPTMNWATEHLPSGALVMPGRSTCDHARAAMQLLSTPRRRHVYAHSGFRRLDDGEWVYLDAHGAVGAEGRVAEIEVELPPALRPMLLEVPRDLDAARAAIRASIALMKLGPPNVMAPVMSLAYRAPIGDVDFSVFVVGKTGVFKSEIAALAQAHFGRDFDARHLPASWTSTDNALEDLTCSAQGSVLVIDDFVSSALEMGRLHARAERVLRAAGNHSARQRMRSDGTLRPPRPPRCAILSTGEDVPRGGSLRARSLIVELEPGAIASADLTRAQQQAADGVFAQALAAYVQWLAPRLDGIRAGWREQVRQLRDAATRDGQHARTPDLAANLATGLFVFLRCAVDLGAIDQAEATRTWDECWGAIQAAAGEQHEYHLQADPAALFLRLVGAALASGRAHVAALDGGAPEDAGRWGWRLEEASARNPTGSWRPLGDRIGWVDGPDGAHVYLQGEASYAAVQRLARDQGDGIVVGLPTLRRRLADRGCLVLEHEGEKRRTEVRVTAEGVRQRVLHLVPGSLLAQEVGQVGQSGSSPSETRVGAGPLSGPLLEAPAKVGHEVGQPEPSNGAASNGVGPLGPPFLAKETPTDNGHDDAAAAPAALEDFAV